MEDEPRGQDMCQVRTCQACRKQYHLITSQSYCFCNFRSSVYFMFCLLFVWFYVLSVFRCLVLCVVLITS